MSIRHRLSCLLAGATLSAALLLAGSGSASAASGSTCSGGPIPGGTYSSLTVTGLCVLLAGDVEVTGNLVVAPGGALNAGFSGSNLKVGGNLIVQNGGILVLGCEPVASPCFNDPTGITNDSVAGNLIGAAALMMLLHHDRFGGQVTQSGGGGGVNCTTFPFGPDGPPAFSTYEDNVVNGNLIVSGLRTCWAGLFRNRVGGSVNYNNNVTSDEDGNEIASNTIAGNLNCSANNPAIQFGDSQGIPNTVAGRVGGQCIAVV